VRRGDILYGIHSERGDIREDAAACDSQGIDKHPFMREPLPPSRRVRLPGNNAGYD
jgi:hypothetical protein